MRVDVNELRRDLQRRRTLVAHTLYECGQCGDRSLGERRCQECEPVVMDMMDLF